MSLLIAFVFIGLICTGYGKVETPCGSAYWEQDYALYFPTIGTTDYSITTTSVPDLTEFTLCFWMKSSAENEGSPFSYCTPTATYGNELLVYNYGSLNLHINNVQRNSHVAANDGRWHYLCFTWTNSDGSYKLYKDAEVIYSDTDFQTGYTIKGNGIPIVGQEQDFDQFGDCGDQFQSYQSFQGHITNLNLWSCLLSAEAITEMYQTCRRGEGDVLKWSDFKYDIHGDTEVVTPSPCE